MTPPLDRRQFLKLASLLPFAPVLDYRPQSVDEQDPPALPSSAPNVVILVFDALSAVHTSLHGYSRQTTPNLARIAEASTVYHACYSSGNFTTPGTASLLTGAYPWSHRALHYFGMVAEAYEDMNLFSLFRAAGYRTIGFTHNPLVSILLHQFRRHLDVLKKTHELGLAERYISELTFPKDFEVAIQSEWLLRREGPDLPGSLLLSLFDKTRRHQISEKELYNHYKSSFPKGLQQSVWPFGGPYFVLEHAIDWITAELGTATQPFLGYFHLYPPHEPYNPRQDCIGLFDDGWVPLSKPSHFFSQGHSDEYLNSLRREYDEYIAYTDAELGRLYDAMVEQGLTDNTYLVVTSDHGELFERGIYGHSTETLYEPVIRVPLLISAPGQRQRRDVYTPTTGVDLLPTLLHASHQPVPDWCEGKALPPFAGETSNSLRSICALELKRNPKQGPLSRGTMALVTEEYKLVHYFGYPQYASDYELYDLANDPEETQDLSESHRAVASDLGDELKAKLREANSAYLES